METKILAIWLFATVFSGWNVQAQTGSKDPVYLEVISTSSKSINYTLGVYPLSCRNNDAGDRTYLTMYIMNQGSNDLIWTKANHVLVVLKNNTLAYNYNTVAETGNYACDYTIAATKGFHEQTLCFEGKFSESDIANIYVIEGGDIFQLIYYKAS